MQMLGHYKAEIGVVGHIHTGLEQAGHSRDRQANHRVGGQAQGNADGGEDTFAVHSTGVQRPSDGNGVAADGGGL
ncbi:hypothetical protein D3C85_1178970 [compost metagenome]